MATRWIALAAAGLAVLGVAYAVEMRTGENVSVTGQFSEMVFAAGDTIDLAVTATDDVMAAGGDVSVRNSTLDHGFLSGGDLTFADSVARDIFAASGELDILSGTISDDLVAAGGRLNLGPEARVDGSVVMAGGRIKLEAPIGGDLRVAGGNIELNATVAGDVFLDARTITIGPDAHISGALTHRGRTVEISPQAQIDGAVTVLEPRPEPNMRAMRALGTWMGAAIAFGMLLTAMVLVALLPRLMNDTARFVIERPLSSVGIGALIAFVAPIAMVILFVTLVGAPLAFVLIAALLLLWPLAMVGAAYALGMFIRRRTGRGDSDASSAGVRVLWAALGTILLIALGLIPVIGWCFNLAAYFFGVGAVSVVALRAFSRNGAAAAPAPA